MVTIIGILIFFAGICFYLKVYYQGLLSNPNTNKIIRFLNIMTPFFSMKYLFPLKYLENDKKEIKEIKKKANIFLYAFYFFSSLVFISIFIIVVFKMA